jgi:hypothetical protein
LVKLVGGRSGGEDKPAPTSQAANKPAETDIPI